MMAVIFAQKYAEELPSCPWDDTVMSHGMEQGKRHTYFYKYSSASDKGQFDQIPGIKNHF